MGTLTGRRWSAILTLALVGCGGGGGGTVDSSPSISNLRYTPATQLQLPGDSATVTGTVDFTDTGLNVSEMHVTTNAVDQKISLTTPTSASGTISASFLVPLDQIGRTTFELWLVDSAGQASNHLGGSFDVLVNDTAPRWRLAQGQHDLARLLNATPLNAGVWTGTQYVFVGHLIVTSPDLVTWSQQNMPSGLVPSGVDSLTGIAWSGSALVAVGSQTQGNTQGVLLRSTDGINWRLQQVVNRCPQPKPTPPCDYKAGLSKVIWAGSQFVAVGREHVPEAGDFALVMTSPDGLNWTQQAKDTLAVGADIDPSSVSNLDIYGMGMSSVAWSGNVFVAVGRAVDGSAAVWTSPDAQSWTVRTPPPLPQFTLRDVVWGLGRFVAVGWSGTLPPVEVLSAATLTSTDGIVWQANQGSLPLSAMNSIGVGPSRFLIASSTDWGTSTDGRQWSEKLNASAGGGNGVLWDGQRWVGISTGGSEIRVSP